MKISILTTITDPDIRQDKWREALTCYCEFADEVVVVNGGAPLSIGFLFKHPKIKVVHMEWPYEWHWAELPRHLNAGLKHCTGDWIIKLDIDQLIHERHFSELKDQLVKCPRDCYVASMQKMTFLYDNKLYQKGGQDICLRNTPSMVFGRNLEHETDLCTPIRQTGTELVWDTVTAGDFEHSVPMYEMPIGRSYKSYRTGVKFYNYDYFFKTQEVTRKEFWRFSRAYFRYYGAWNFGSTEELAFNTFLTMMKSRHDQAKYEVTVKDHPCWMQEAVHTLNETHFGLNAWNLI